jgi:integrase
MSIVRRVRRDGTVAYQVRVSVTGQRLHAETFDTHREARRREAELITRRRRSTTAETCDSFAERWPDDFPIVKSGPTRGRRKSERTTHTNRERLKPFVREFRGIRLADVDRLRAVRFAAQHPSAAAVARGMFQDAVDIGLIDTNPFTRLNLEEKRGRRDHAPLTIEELHRLADLSLAVHGPEYGPVMRGMILFTAYAGPRLEEGCALEWPWIDFARSEVTFKVAKFDKPRTVLLLDEAADALRGMPRPAQSDARVFRTKRGKPIRGRPAHYWSWNPVRAAFWATLPERRRDAIVDLDWHSLRHFCGWYFYVHLGFSDELTAYQLGHADAKLVRDLYGHGRADALERLKRGARVQVRAIDATPLPHAASEGA